MASTYGDEETRKFALHYLPKVARTGSHLQMFVDYITSMRGWGRGLRRAVAEWYTEKDINAAVYQAVKYRQRYNWTHRDLLRKAHPKAASSVFNDFFAWITQGTMPDEDNDYFSLIHAYEEAKTADVNRLTSLIAKYQMTWEMVPAEMLDKKLVWAALANHMPITALVRNLATLTRLGVIAPMQSAWACQRLNAIGNPMTEGYSIIHPINVLSALLTYRSGKSVRGSNTWTPVPQVVDALDLAFERSFATAPQTNQWFYLGIDVSSSMGSGEVAGVPGLSPRMAAAAMAMVIARREPNYYMAGFAADGDWTRPGMSLRYRGSQMAPLSITASDSLSDAIQKTNALPFGRTDCALPMLDALEKKIPVDIFVILTDSETWAGNIHPIAALEKYRKEMGIPAKLVVVGMVSNGFSIADPSDGGMMDVVGFDAAAPALIADFAMSGGAATVVHPAVVEPEDVPAENVGYTEDF